MVDIKPIIKATDMEEDYIKAVIEISTKSLNLYK
jgi:hypothetical protein